MGKKILVWVAGLLALVGGGVKALSHSAEHATTYGDDFARAERAVEHRPPPIPHLPRSGGGSSEAREAVEGWTSELSPDDAKDVVGAACKLSEAYVTQTQVQQWTYQYGEDKLRAFRGLVKEMRENPGVKVACTALG